MGALVPSRIRSLPIQSLHRARRPARCPCFACRSARTADTRSVRCVSNTSPAWPIRTRPYPRRRLRRERLAASRRNTVARGAQGIQTHQTQLHELAARAGIGFHSTGKQRVEPDGFDVAYRAELAGALFDRASGRRRVALDLGDEFAKTLVQRRMRSAQSRHKRRFVLEHCLARRRCALPATTVLGSLAPGTLRRVMAYLQAVDGCHRRSENALGPCSVPNPSVASPMRNTTEPSMGEGRETRKQRTFSRRAGQAEAPEPRRTAPPG